MATRQHVLLMTSNTTAHDKLEPENNNRKICQLAAALKSDLEMFFYNIEHIYQNMAIENTTLLVNLVRYSLLKV